MRTILEVSGNARLIGEDQLVVVVPSRRFRGSQVHARRLTLHYGILAEVGGYGCRCHTDVGLHVFTLSVGRGQKSQVEALLAEIVEIDEFCLLGIE